MSSVYCGASSYRESYSRSHHTWKIPIILVYLSFWQFCATVTASYMASFLNYEVYCKKKTKINKKKHTETHHTERLKTAPEKKWGYVRDCSLLVCKNKKKERKIRKRLKMFIDWELEERPREQKTEKLSDFGVEHDEDENSEALIVGGGEDECGQLVRPLRHSLRTDWANLLPLSLSFNHCRCLSLHSTHIHSLVSFQLSFFFLWFFTQQPAVIHIHKHL